MIGTALLSGIFGMAGGLILIGVLLVALPAAAGHGAACGDPDGVERLAGDPVVAPHRAGRSMAFYVAGCLVSVGLWSITLYVPDKAVALLMLGLSPFVIRAIPEKILPRTFGPAQVAVHRPAVDDADAADRRHRSAARHDVPALAARAAADHRHQGRLPGVRPRLQAHLLRRADRPGRRRSSRGSSASPSPRRSIGTSLGKLLLERLSDTQFRVWSNRLITALASYYVGYGLVLLARHRLRWRVSSIPSRLSRAH